MSGARNLLATMRSAGAMVLLEGGKVVVNGASRLPLALLAEAKATRDDLLAVLRAEAYASGPASPAPRPAPATEPGTDWQHFDAWAAPWGQHAPPQMPDRSPCGVPPAPLLSNNNRGPIHAGDWCLACRGRRWWRMDARYPWVCAVCLPSPDPASGIWFEGTSS